MLKDQINVDFKEAYKSKNEKIYSPLRMLISVIKKEEIDQRKELNDEEVISLVKSEVKKRKESIEEYTKGGRKDLADGEKSELEILSKYLPEQMSDEELKKIVADMKEKTGSQNVQNFGKLMGAVMKEVGAKADGQRVSTFVKKILASEE